MINDPLDEPIAFHLNPEDVSDCRDARKALTENRALLLQKMTDYPLEVCFSHFRFVFEKEQHIDRVLTWLDREFERIDGPPEISPPPPPQPPAPPTDQGSWFGRWMRRLVSLILFWRTSTVEQPKPSSEPSKILTENPEDTVKRYVRPGGILLQHVPACREMLQALNEEKNRKLIAYYHSRGIPVCLRIPHWRGFVCWNMDEYDDIVRWLERALERLKPKLVA